MINTGRDNYMTVWSIKDENGKVSGKVSTSKKDVNGKYVNSKWNVNFVSAAAEKAKTLKERDRIKLAPGGCYVDNKYYPAEGDKAAHTYVYVTIFDFEKLNNKDDLPF